MMLLDSEVKASASNAGETRVWSLGWENPLEKEMVTHSSIFAWRIPWTEEPGRLQSTGWQRVGHDWVTSLSHASYYILTKEECEAVITINTESKEEN